MTVARLQRTITHYRTRLMQQEAGAVASLESAYAGVLAAIQPHLDRLYEDITAKLNAGEEIPATWLYDRLRLENLTLLIQQQVDQYGSLALMHTRQLQHLGLDLGIEAALQLLDATVPVGVRWTFGTPNTVALERLVGATQAGSPLADLFSGFGQEAAKLVRQALISGVAQGNGPREIAPQVRQALGVSRNRALVLTRTESIRAYRGASQEVFRANEDVVDKWRWTCAKQARTCAACLAMDGTLHPLSEEMGSHPQCRCTPVPITKSWDAILKPFGIDASSIPDSGPQLQTGADWLKEQPAAVQKAILQAKYEGWKAGQFELKDMVKKTFDKDWGHSIQEKPLKALVKQ
jgi:SPP1 gp7 family putative phage head morphogenesis protein